MAGTSLWFSAEYTRGRLCGEMGSYVGSFLSLEEGQAVYDTAKLSCILIIKQQEEQYERNNYLRKAGLTPYDARP